MNLLDTSSLIKDPCGLKTKGGNLVPILLSYMQKLVYTDGHYDVVCRTPSFKAKHYTSAFGHPALATVIHKFHKRFLVHLNTVYYYVKKGDELVLTNQSISKVSKAFKEYAWDANKCLHVHEVIDDKTLPSGLNKLRGILVFNTFTSKGSDKRNGTYTIEYLKAYQYTWNGVHYTKKWINHYIQDKLALNQEMAYYLLGLLKALVFNNTRLKLPLIILSDDKVYDLIELFLGFVSDKVYYCSSLSNVEEGKSIVLCKAANLDTKSVRAYAKEYENRVSTIIVDGYLNSKFYTGYDMFVTQFATLDDRFYERLSLPWEYFAMALYEMPVTDPSKVTSLSFIRGPKNIKDFIMETVVSLNCSYYEHSGSVYLNLKCLYHEYWTPWSRANGCPKMTQACFKEYMGDYRVFIDYPHDKRLSTAEGRALYFKMGTREQILGAIQEVNSKKVMPSKVYWKCFRCELMTNGGSSTKDYYYDEERDIIISDPKRDLKELCRECSKEHDEARKAYYQRINSK